MRVTNTWAFVLIWTEQKSLIGIRIEVWIIYCIISTFLILLESLTSMMKQFWWYKNIKKLVNWVQLSLTSFKCGSTKFLILPLFKLKSSFQLFVFMLWTNQKLGAILWLNLKYRKSDFRWIIHLHLHSGP
jgi:hypothetical protein